MDTKFEKQIVLLFIHFFFVWCQRNQLLLLETYRRLKAITSLMFDWYGIHFWLMNWWIPTEKPISNLTSSQISLKSNQVLHRTVIRIIKRKSKDKKADESKWISTFFPFKPIFSWFPCKMRHYRTSFKHYDHLLHFFFFLRLMHTSCFRKFSFTIPLG